MKNLDVNIKLGAVLLLFVAVLAGCSDERANAEAGTAASPPPSVTVAVPVQKDVVHFAEYTGLTEAPESVDIRARVEGELEQVHFRPGQIVKKGDVLFSIDDAHFRAQVNEARATLALREAELSRARTMSERMQKLRAAKAISEMDDIEARTDMKSALASVAAAKATLARAALNLSYTKVTAPIFGRISDSRVDVGNLVGAGERTLLTTIVQDGFLHVTFSVSERELLNYMNQVGHEQSPTTIRTPVSVGLANQKGFPFKGHIDFIENRVDPESGTIRVRAVFPNTDHRVLPGLYAKVQVPVGIASPELLVPDTAVGKDQQGQFLLVVDEKNVVQYQPVTTGPLVDGLRVVSQGLKGSDRVVVNGLQRTRPGTSVTPVDATAAQAGAHRQG